MKKLFSLSFLDGKVFALAAALALAWAGCQSSPQKPHGTVVVNYVHPESFTDMRSVFNGPTDQAYLDDLRDYIETWAGRRLREGLTLTMTFTDIDMAGEINPRATDMRVISSFYPLRIKFSWVVTDASGKALKEGKEELVNVFPGAQTGFDRNDPLFHEKDAMDEWISKTWRANRAAK